MISSQKFELITARTTDGITLHGGLLEAEPEIERVTNFDSAILMHGAGANFYSVGFYRMLIPTLLELGIPVLAVNNRGHDGLYGTSHAGMFSWQGAAYEHVGSAHHDIAAWIDLAKHHGLNQIVLIGHSLGAIKVLLSQAYHASASVRAVIASSPPHLSHQRFVESKRRDQFLDTYGEAQQLVVEERGDELIQVGFPFPMWISATNYVDKYGPQEEYNILRFADLVELPVMFTYGEKELETGVSFQGLDQQLTELFQPRADFDLRVIPGADHFYSGVDDLLASEIRTWLCK